MVSVVALLVLAGTCQAQPKVNLTGTWEFNWGGTATVRQYGTEVWWVAKGVEDGKPWTHAFRGKIQGDKLIGDYADVEAKKPDRGTITLDIITEGGNAVRLSGKWSDGGDTTMTRTKPEKKWPTELVAAARQSILLLPFGATTRRLHIRPVRANRRRAD
jgi:hypothetical protein